MLDRGRLLLGAFDNEGDAVSFASRVGMTSGDLVRAQWSRARQSYLTVDRGGSFARPVHLYTESLRLVTQRLDAPLFRSSLKGRRWRLASVPLQTLLTPQPLLNLSRLEAMARNLRQGFLPTMFPTETQLNLKTETSDGPTIALIADRGELAVSAATVRRTAENGPIEIVFRVEPRPNYVSVLDCDGSLVVRNGNHRLVAAWQTGLREVPCVIVDGELAELSQGRWDHFSTCSLSGFRPPRLVDFCMSTSTCAEIDLRNRLFVTHVRAEQTSGYEGEESAL